MLYFGLEVFVYAFCLGLVLLEVCFMGLGGYLHERREFVDCGYQVNAEVGIVDGGLPVLVAF